MTGPPDRCRRVPRGTGPHGRAASSSRRWHRPPTRRSGTAPRGRHASSRTLPRPCHGWPPPGRGRCRPAEGSSSPWSTRGWPPPTSTSPRGPSCPARASSAGTATTDETGHGTAIAGVIAARDIGEKSGVVGLAKGARILPVKITGGEAPGDEEQQRSANLAKGISYAVSAGADVINLSLSTTSNRPDVRAAVASAVRAGIVVVASGGNRDRPPRPRTASATPLPTRCHRRHGGGRARRRQRELHPRRPGRPRGPGRRRDHDLPRLGRLCTSRRRRSRAAMPRPMSAPRPRWCASGSPRRHRPRSPTGSRPRRHGARATERDDVSGWGVVQPFEAMTAVLDDTVAGPVAPGAKPRVTATTGGVGDRPDARPRPSRRRPHDRAVAAARRRCVRARARHDAPAPSADPGLSDPAAHLPGLRRPGRWATAYGDGEPGWAHG